MYSMVFGVPGGPRSSFSKPGGAQGALWGPLGDVLGALEGLLEASWKPLGDLLRPYGSQEATKEPPGTAWKPFLRVFTCVLLDFKGTWPALEREARDIGERRGHMLKAS